MRSFDEKIPLKYGLVGQEEGGFTIVRFTMYDLLRGAGTDCGDTAAPCTRH